MRTAWQALLVGIFAAVPVTAQEANPAPLPLLATAKGQAPPGLAKTVTRTGPAKIALLASQEVETARIVQDLALVQLSADNAFTLLDRATVARLLQEQKLSLSGLVDANTAVKAGKILAVDLLVVIDHSSATKQNTGVVVFDAVTGVRLDDIGFARPETDQQARETAAGVRLAVAKWRAGTKNLKTICFLPVRNADLPRHFDALCGTLSAMLERQLLHHPAIVTLERKRLDGVSQEKALSTEAVTRELLTSVLLVEMEVGKALKSDGLRATVTIRDNAGKQLHKIAHEVADPNGAKLLEPLVRRVQEALSTVQVQAGAQRDREAQRFLREAEILWKHQHYQQAIQAAEAAYALQDDDAARLLLAEYLMLFARETLKPGIVAATRYEHLPFDASPEAVRSALAFARRGGQLIEIAKPATVNRSNDHGYWSRAESGKCFDADRNVLFELELLRVKPVDPETEEEVRAFRGLNLRRQLDRLKELAQRVGPKGTADLTRAMFDPYMDQLRYFAPDTSAAAAAVREALSLWIEHTRHLTADTFPTESALLFGERVLPCIYYANFQGSKQYTKMDRELSLPLLKALEEHPYPVIRLYAGHWHAKQLRILERITVEEARKRHRQSIEEVKSWIDKAPFKDPPAHRVAFYDLLGHILKDPPALADRKEAAQIHLENYLGVAEFMLQRGDVVARLWIDAASEIGRQRVDHARALPLIRRMLKRYDEPPHRLFADPGKRVKSELERTVFVILKASPHLDTDRPPSPWDKVTTLADGRAFPKARVLMAPTRWERHVYVLAGSNDSPTVHKPYLQLIRAHLDGSPPQPLGKAYVALDPKRPANAFWDLPRFVTETVVHGEHLYAGTVRDGIYAFPLAGGNGVRIGEKEGLPSPAVVSLTALDGKLVAALDDGYLVMHDLETRRCDVIASSRRTEALSPFDNSKPFRADNLRADPARQRALLQIYQVDPKHPNTGMWEYNLKTRQFKKLLPIPFCFPSTVQDGKLYLRWRSWSIVQRAGKSAWQEHESFGQLDLTKDRFTLLQGKNPEGMAEQKPAGIPADVSAALPMLPGGEASRLYHGGYRWLSSPFGRVPIQGGKDELLPHVGVQGTDAWFNVHFSECLQAVSPTELLVGDAHGLYLVRLKHGSSSPAVNK